MYMYMYVYIHIYIYIYIYIHIQAGEAHVRLLRGGDVERRGLHGAQRLPSVQRLLSLFVYLSLHFLAIGSLSSRVYFRIL